MSWRYRLLTLITLELTLREIWIVDENSEHLWITDEVKPQHLIGIRFPSLGCICPLSCLDHWLYLHLQHAP